MSTQKLNNALIGYTGFVGGTLERDHEFSSRYNSKNIEEIAGKNFDMIYCAGAPAAKWIANGDPKSDRANIDRLLGAVRGATAKRVVLLSTVDVYKRAVNVNENMEPPVEGLSAYGLNRLHLEKELSSSFEATVIRLPGLFGDGLRKNAIYDLLNNNAVEKVESRGTFQFYDMRNLWDDIEQAISLGIKLLHVSSPPLSIEEIAREAFGREFRNELPGTPAIYDFKSIHANSWGGQDGYLYSRDSILQGIKEFVRANAKEKAA